MHKNTFQDTPKRMATWYRLRDYIGDTQKAIWYRLRDYIGDKTEATWYRLRDSFWR